MDITANLKKMRIPIAVKLVGITTLLLLVAAVSITLFSSHDFRKMSSTREDDVNGNEAKVMAQEMETTLQDFINRAKIVGGILYRNFPTEADREAALDLSFRSDNDMVAVEVISMRDGKPASVRKAVNEAYLKQYDLKVDFLDNLRQAKPFPLPVIFAGEVEVHNSTVEGGLPLLTLGLPLVKDDSGNITDIVLADIRPDRIQSVFKNASESERTMYLVDRDGRVLAHPDEHLVFSNKKMDELPIVRNALTKKSLKGQLRFEDPETELTYAGAFARTKYGVTVISQVPESVILEPSIVIKRKAFLITGIVLSAALFFIILFSTTLTRPLEVLVETTKEVAKGNFDARAHIATKDEVGELAQAFDKMVDGLKERDKVKSLFNKFHGTGVANKLITGEMKLGGEQREATVFFSDIRSFTSFSEKVTPQEVVDMLNEYFKVMVSIINKNKGVVDKFIGDAIMAIYGAPLELKDGAYQCVKTAVEMRTKLEKLNDKWKAEKKPQIQVGYGINTGDAIVGNIGSERRMEYTAIGDMVNTAARIEGETEGGQILITEATFKELGNRVLVKKLKEVSLKGKSAKVQLYEVTGLNAGA